MKKTLTIEGPMWIGYSNRCPLYTSTDGKKKKSVEQVIIEQIKDIVPIIYTTKDDFFGDLYSRLKEHGYLPVKIQGGYSGGSIKDCIANAKKIKITIEVE